MIRSDIQGDARPIHVRLQSDRMRTFIATAHDLRISGVAALVFAWSRSHVIKMLRKSFGAGANDPGECRRKASVCERAVDH